MSIYMSSEAFSHLIILKCSYILENTKLVVFASLSLGIRHCFNFADRNYKFPYPFIVRKLIIIKLLY